MSGLGCTPIEVLEIIRLDDKDLGARCLEVIRTHLPMILSGRGNFQLEVIPLCHHHALNCYPALGVFGAEDMEEVFDAQDRINTWVSDRGLDWLVDQTKLVVVPSWEVARSKMNSTASDGALLSGEE